MPIPNQSLVFQPLNVTKLADIQKGQSLNLNLVSSKLEKQSQASSTFSVDLTILNQQQVVILSQKSALDQLSYIGGLVSTIFSFFGGILGAFNFYIFFKTILKTKAIKDQQDEEL